MGWIKKGKSRVKRIIKKKTVKKPTKTMQNTKMALKHHMVVAPEFHTKCEITYAGYFPAGITQNGYFAISGNSLHIPSNSTLPAAIVTLPNVGGLTTVPYGGIAINSSQPAGFSNLCSTTSPYNRYRVNGSKIKIRINPINPADEIYYNVIPIESGVSYPVTVIEAQSAPNVSRTACASTYYRSSITKSAKTSFVFGIKQASMGINDNLGATGSATPVQEWAWLCNYQLSQGVVSAGKLPFFITIEYDCTFYAPNTGGLSDT